MTSFHAFLHLIKLCPRFPVITLQHTDPTGHKSCPVTKYTDIVGIFSQVDDLSVLYNMHMTYSLYLQLILEHVPYTVVAAIPTF